VLRTELDTNCEIVWATIKSTGNKTLYLGTYYRPSSDKGESLEQLNDSISRVCNKTNATVYLVGSKYSYGEMLSDSHASEPNIIVGLHDSII
jgi:hypothetical protein